jgi:hypothetical protein
VGHETPPIDLDVAYLCAFLPRFAQLRQVFARRQEGFFDHLRQMIRMPACATADRSLWHSER